MGLAARGPLGAVAGDQLAVAVGVHQGMVTVAAVAERLQPVARGSMAEPSPKLAHHYVAFFSQLRTSFTSVKILLSAIA